MTRAWCSPTSSRDAKTRIFHGRPYGPVSTFTVSMATTSADRARRCSGTRPARRCPTTRTPAMSTSPSSRAHRSISTAPAYAAPCFIVNPPGSDHGVTSPGGCLVLVVWQEPPSSQLTRPTRAAGAPRSSSASPAGAARRTSRTAATRARSPCSDRSSPRAPPSATSTSCTRRGGIVGGKSPAPRGARGRRGARARDDPGRHQGVSNRGSFGRAAERALRRARRRPRVAAAGDDHL